MPTIFPMLVEVPHVPVIRPLCFGLNHYPTVDTRHGKIMDWLRPIKIKHIW